MGRGRYRLDGLDREQHREERRSRQLELPLPVGSGASVSGLVLLLALPTPAACLYFPICAAAPQKAASSALLGDKAEPICSATSGAQPGSAAAPQHPGPLPVPSPGRAASVLPASYGRHGHGWGCLAPGASPFAALPAEGSGQVPAPPAPVPCPAPGGTCGTGGPLPAPLRSAPPPGAAAAGAAGAQLAPPLLQHPRARVPPLPHARTPTNASWQPRTPQALVCPAGKEHGAFAPPLCTAHSTLRNPAASTSPSAGTERNLSTHSPYTPVHVLTSMHPSIATSLALFSCVSPCFVHTR